jgi:hypothetical protein
VAWTDVGEVTAIHRGNGHDGQPLADRDHRRIRAAQPPVGIAPHQLGHAPQVLIHQTRELETVARPDTDTVQERGFCGRPEILVDQVASLRQDRRQNDQRLIAASKPIPAPRMVGIATVGQRKQHVRVNNDHEPRTLPAEPLRQQFIDALRYVRASAITDSDELRYCRCLLVLWQVFAERFQQPERARGLLLAQMSDKLLELLLRGHASSVDSDQPTQVAALTAACEPVSRLPSFT